VSHRYKPSEKARRLMDKAIKNYSSHPENLIIELEKIKKEDLKNIFIELNPSVKHGRYKE